MKISSIVIVLFVTSICFNLSLTRAEDKTYFQLKLPSKKIPPMKCTPFEITHVGSEQFPDTNFAFKTIGKIKIYSDPKCQQISNGIGKIKYGQISQYFLSIEKPGKSTISVISLDKSKWTISQNIITDDIGQLEADAQKNRERILNIDRSLRDSDVVDLVNLNGEIKPIAYNNLDIELNSSDVLWIKKCIGPVHILIKNASNIIKGNQYAEFILQKDEHIGIYSNDSCQTPITSLKFSNTVPNQSIFLKATSPIKGAILLTNREKTFAKRSLNFAEEPKYTLEDKAIAEFENRLNLQVFETEVLTKVDPILKDTFKEKFSEYEKVKKTKQDPYRSHLIMFYRLHLLKKQ